MTTAALSPSLSERVAHLLIAIPSATTMEQLAAIDPFTLSPTDRIDYLSALERQDGWLYALKQRAITAVAGLSPTEGGGPFSGVDEAEREDVSTALRLAPATAQSRIDIARTLINNLPRTCAALALVFPVEAQITAFAPSSAALEIAIVIPRSLNDPVGLAPSTFSHTSFPSISDKVPQQLRGDRAIVESCG